jgi:hypothetical protein
MLPRQKADPQAHRPSADPELLYELRPGHHDGLQDPRSEPGGWSLRVNTLGQRGVERSLQRAPAMRRVLALGSSNTWGARVSDGEGWPERLEQALQARGQQVEVWNLGVSGYTARQLVASGRRWVRHAQPDLVIVQMYNVGTRLVLAGEAAGKVVLRDPSLWCEQLLTAPCPGEVGWTLFRHSALRRTLTVALDRRHLSREREDFVARVSARADREDRERLLSFARELGPIPLRILVTPAGLSAAWLDGLGLPVWDLREDAQPFGERGLQIHPEADVYRWYGEVLADKVGALWRAGPPPP